MFLQEYVKLSATMAGKHLLRVRKPNFRAPGYQSTVGMIFIFSGPRFWRWFQWRTSPRLLFIQMDCAAPLGAFCRAHNLLRNKSAVDEHIVASGTDLVPPLNGLNKRRMSKKVFSGTVLLHFKDMVIVFRHVVWTLKIFRCLYSLFWLWKILSFIHVL